MSARTGLGSGQRDRFFALSLDMLCIADFQGYFIDLNPAWERVLGWSIDELTARPFIDFVHPEDREATNAEAASLRNSIETTRFENRYQRKDGSYTWLAWRAVADPENHLYYAVARDITDRKQAEREIVEERNRLAAILASIADGAIITDSRGRILSVNPAMEKLAGWHEDEVRGRTFSDVYPAADESGAAIPIERRFLTHAISTREPITSRGYGISVRTRHGVDLPVHVSAAPVLGADGDLLGAVLVMRDMSYERDVDELKTSIVSTVSHELRTPLTMILGFTDLLLRGRLEGQQASDALTEVHSSAKRLSRLIDDLLSVARIEAGRISANRVPFKLDELVLATVPTMAQDRHVLIDVDADLPLVLADRDHVTQILLNLVSNALKYSPPETLVELHAAQSGSSIDVSVTDHGFGLSEEDMGKLFQKFSRVDRPELSHVPGTGLGLFITKRLVEMQPGVLHVRSTLGRGTTFTFSLPTEAETRGG